jgi:DNA-binding beta-propeller fold protein YncE
MMNIFRATDTTGLFVPTTAAKLFSKGDRQEHFSHIDRVRPIITALVLVFSCGYGEPGIGQVAQAQTPPPADSRANAGAKAVANPYPHRIPAPPLAGGEWVNTAAPLSLADLRGKYVLLDFWTFCCINCMHVLPELKKVEHAFPNELVVVGVHSAKFLGERATDNIREAALRYEIEHPVINDAKMTIWNTYGARSWPTLVLIDPAGDVVWAASGERTFEEIKGVVDRGLPYYRAQGLLRPGPRPALVDLSKLPVTPLKYPGKLLADAAGGRLFIADSNHNRIVVAKLDGQLQQVIGSGAIGRGDGGFDECSFNHPQGIALAGNMLYIADTENHLLRKADLAARRVATIAGTGDKGSAWSDFGAVRTGSLNQNTGPGRRSPKATALSTPWALCEHANDLFIAMAGMHQIWKMPLDEISIGPYAGNAREDIADGPLLPNMPYDLGFSSFAQPSGLSSDGKRLFVADSEGSTVRSVPFDANGKVETLVGLTGTLFDFGDADGSGRDVRLQHPLDVAWNDGKLYVADTYNNKIKVIDVDRHTCQTIAGTGQAGNADADRGSAAKFNEPAGISSAGGKLYVADTNSHLIRVVELAAPYRVSTLKIEGLAAPKVRP